MARIEINKLGPISHCDLEINDFMVFTGPQASGKSTIAKSIFFFKNIKSILLEQLRRRYLFDNDNIKLSVKNRFIREIRSVFLQTFGSTWCMDRKMSLKYSYTDSVSISISLKDDPRTPNYIWIELSDDLSDFLISYDKVSVGDDFLGNWAWLARETQKIELFFDDDKEAVYIPAGRSMITLLSTQLNYIYGSMDDAQKRNLDYCTQNYLERILRMKPFLKDGISDMIREKLELTDMWVNRELLSLCTQLMNSILNGEYRVVSGEERLQVSQDRYVKINFASSGQQESVWILNVLFFNILNNKKAYFIIEEPESHLFPNAQKLMAEFISVAQNSGNQVLLTTHSPYILGTINNLLYANKISNKVKSWPLNNIINHYKWLDFAKLSAFFITYGECESCLDEEFKSIKNEVIDGASEDINNDYEKMLLLEEELEKEEH